VGLLLGISISFMVHSGSIMVNQWVFYGVLVGLLWCMSGSFMVIFDIGGQLGPSSFVRVDNWDQAIFTWVDNWYQMVPVVHPCQKWHGSSYQWHQLSYIP